MVIYGPISTQKILGQFESGAVENFFGGELILHEITQHDSQYPLVK